MIFKRREKRSFSQALRDLVAPRKGWRRGLKYIGRRVQRLPDTPHRIALGFACGVMASFTPFFTLHAIVAAIIAWTARGNIVAGVLGTITNNPLTIAPIAAINLHLGNWMLGVQGGATSIDGLSLDLMWRQPQEAFDLFAGLFVPYLVGGLAPGVLAGVIAYVLLKPVVARFQNRRRRTLSERAKALLAARAAARGEPAGGSEDDGDDGPPDGSGTLRGVRIRPAGRRAPPTGPTIATFARPTPRPS